MFGLLSARGKIIVKQVCSTAIAVLYVILYSIESQPYYYIKTWLDENVVLNLLFTTSASEQLISFTNPRMHLFHIPQSSIQNRNVHISVLNGALWDMEQVHSGICEIGLFLLPVSPPIQSDRLFCQVGMALCFHGNKVAEEQGHCNWASRLVSCFEKPLYYHQGVFCNNVTWKSMSSPLGETWSLIQYKDWEWELVKQ